MMTTPDSSPFHGCSRTRELLPRLDTNPIRERLLPYCRLTCGKVWEDPVRGHRVGVLDAARAGDMEKLAAGARIDCLIADPPYNIPVGGKQSEALFHTESASYLAFSERWIEAGLAVLAADAHFYLWLGADVRDGFQPLPDVMLLLRRYPTLHPRNFITVRNQRGYGTQANWMWVRQELLHYAVGNPVFHVVYTDIPKVLAGYYKVVGGARKDNLARGKSPYIRPGNVWIDIQQVFYRMEENVPGCYAQKPLKAIERILLSSTDQGMNVADPFAHSGTTLIAGERLGRRVFTADSDPVYAEITIRRLERFRAEGLTGWQWQSPFPEIDSAGPDGAPPR